MRNLLLLTLLVFLAANAFGQTTSLNGTVTDPTGSVVPDAAISIVNVQPGVQRATTADSQGRYTLAQLTPGTYKLTAKAPGFADVELNNIELQVNAPATVPIVFSKIGSTTTTVVVESVATQVNTTDASLGNVITSDAIIELPMYARNIV